MWRCLRGPVRNSQLDGEEMSKYKLATSRGPLLRRADPQELRMRMVSAMEAHPSYWWGQDRARHGAASPWVPYTADMVEGEGLRTLLDAGLRVWATYQGGAAFWLERVAP